jgi:hypothetical protein
VVLKDRATGTLYLLSHNAADDTVELVTPVPAQAKARPTEPIIQSDIGPLRVYASGGEFRYEAAEAGVIGPPLHTLNCADKRVTYRVTGAGVTAVGDPLRLVKLSGLGDATTVEDLGNVATIPSSPVFAPGVFAPGVFA